MGAARSSNRTGRFILVSGLPDAGNRRPGRCVAPILRSHLGNFGYNDFGPQSGQRSGGRGRTLTSGYENHLRSLVLLHDQIKQDQDMGEKGEVARKSKPRSAPRSEFKPYGPVPKVWNASDMNPFDFLATSPVTPPLHMACYAKDGSTPPLHVSGFITTECEINAQCHWPG